MVIFHDNHSRSPISLDFNLFTETKYNHSPVPAKKNNHYILGNIFNVTINNSSKGDYIIRTHVTINLLKKKAWGETPIESDNFQPECNYCYIPDTNVKRSLNKILLYQNSKQLGWLVEMDITNGKIGNNNKLYKIINLNNYIKILIFL